MAAYEYLLTGKVLHHRSTRESNAEALRMLDRAIKLDPDYAHAHAWKACVVGQAWLHGWCERADATVQVISEELQMALALDDNDADVHRVLAALKLDLQRARQGGLSSGTRAEPQSEQRPDCRAAGEVLTWLGRAEEGIEWIRRAMRLNPYHPERFWSHLGRAQYSARAMATRSHPQQADGTRSDPSRLSCRVIGPIGNRTAASAHTHEVLQRQPDFTVQHSWKPCIIGSRRTPNMCAKGYRRPGCQVK